MFGKISSLKDHFIHSTCHHIATILSHMHIYSLLFYVYKYYIFLLILTRAAENQAMANSVSFSSFILFLVIVSNQCMLGEERELKEAKNEGVVAKGGEMNSKMGALPPLPLMPFASPFRCRSSLHFLPSLYSLPCPLSICLVFSFLHLHHLEFEGP